MMNKNNAYFEELKRIGHEWEAARIERKARKQQIIDTLGWESDELKAWYEEDAAAKFPFEQGVSKAYRAWATSISRKEDELEMDDFLWEREVTDFVETLRKAGIKTFVYTNQSTAVMEMPLLRLQLHAPHPQTRERHRELLEVRHHQEEGWPLPGQRRHPGRQAEDGLRGRPRLRRV